MKSNHVKLWAMALALVVSFGLISQARATTVTATLDPQQISPGDSAQLTVTVSGSQDQPTVPTVDGLDITAVGQSTQIEFINGSMTATASVTYQVTPRREGTFTIPAIRAGAASSKPVTLRVGNGTAGSGPASPAPNLPPPVMPPSTSGPVVLPPAGTAPASNDATPTPEGRFGSIQVTLPKKEFFVGELVPIDIKAYIPDDVQATITDLPQFTSDGFTLNSLSTKPDRSSETGNGRGYTVFTWHSALTAVKVGDYPFDLKMPMTVIVQRQIPQAMDAGDMFNNFFRNAMSGMETKIETTLKSTHETLKILPLPLTDRPADFGGAVGQFEIEASATPVSVNAGDPITLRLKITGTGNFDRISSDMLSSGLQWKTYAPKNHFEPGDSVGYQGAKTFEQPIIPNDAGVSSVPSVSFSYFDPETRQYVTKTTAPIAVTVNVGVATPASSPVVAANSPPSTNPAPQPPTPAPDLRINRIDPGSYVASLQPVYLNPWFVAGQGLPLLALLGALAFVRFQKQVSHPERMRAVVIEQAIRQQVAAMDAAMHERRTDAFFIHARTAIQQRLGQQWNIRPESITLADVESRVSTGLDTIRPVFEMADQAKYSDLHFEESDLIEWRQAVLNELVEKKS